MFSVSTDTCPQASLPSPLLSSPFLTSSVAVNWRWQLRGHTNRLQSWVLGKVPPPGRTVPIAFSPKIRSTCCHAWIASHRKVKKEESKLSALSFQHFHGLAKNRVQDDSHFISPLLRPPASPWRSDSTAHSHISLLFSLCPVLIHYLL